MQTVDAGGMQRRGCGAVGCRPGDRIDKSFVAQDTPPKSSPPMVASILSRAAKNIEEH